MDDIRSKIDKLASEISESQKTKEDEARASICIFLIGCYCSKHKPYLIKAKEILINQKIPCMLMDDLKIPEIDYDLNPDWSLKFRLICDKILQSYRMPILFMYASDPTEDCKGGSNFELVTVCENPKYEKLKTNFRIFSEEGAELPNHEKHILYHVHVKDGDDFITTAIKRSETEIVIMSDILSRHDDGGKK